MRGSRRYLDSLASLHAMLEVYPTQADISDIRVMVEPQPAIVVRLREAEPAEVAAGLVEWQRTLGEAETWVWRTVNGKEMHIVVTGYGTECGETPITVLAGPITYDRLDIDIDLDPGGSERLGAETLHAWLGAEIVRAWPFDTHLE